MKKDSKSLRRWLVFGKSGQKRRFRVFLETVDQKNRDFFSRLFPQTYYTLGPKAPSLKF